MAEEDVCAVCMEALSAQPHAQMPGCRHSFHVTCMLNCIQYDARCPVCRAAPEGVTPREPEEAPTLATVVLDMEELEEGMRRMREISNREWRRYSDRRRRVLRQRPYLSERMTRLREVRCVMDREYEDANRIYDQKCREVWRADPEVKTHRDALIRLRRRERRLHRQLELELEGLIGPEPT